MKIYLAGCSAEANREKRWLKAGAINRLISYHLHVTKNKLNKDTHVIFNKIKENKTK